MALVRFSDTHFFLYDMIANVVPQNLEMIGFPQTQLLLKREKHSLGR